MTDYILSIDQGTTSSRAMLFNGDGRSCFTAQQEFTQFFPHPGRVEHDADEIWDTTLEVTRKAVASANGRGDRIHGIGITNQRETTVIWDRNTGQPIHKAIVWQDRRTADFCNTLREAGKESMVASKTGLLLDPYFSATKVTWILDNVEGARQRAERGELAFGTIDSFLIWRLTAGRVHATDVSNASRTLMFNIHTLEWDDELLELFNIPASLLPEVRENSDDYGQTDRQLLGESIPITGVAGDQQAALIGQACFERGMIKSTYGTGCFVILNTGEQAISSNNKLLTTIAYRINGKTTYALEGSIFVAGAAIKWLRDTVGLIDDAAITEQIAKAIDSNHDLYLVPAFTGLGAPYWEPEARGSLLGMTLNTSDKDIVRATLESVCYQTSDLFDAFDSDGLRPKQLRIDGGMVKNNWVCQRLSDLLGVPVERPVETETTALGAAFLAGLKAGMYSSLEDIADKWELERNFTVDMESLQRVRLLDGWQRAVQATKKFIEV